MSKERDLWVPLISVITVCLDNHSGIEKTIRSVINQNYPRIEFIIIDGGSTDGTVEIIQKHQSQIKYWISERDAGISDAFNKGLKQAKGTYIAFLNSGDYYLDKNSIQILVNFAKEFDVIYGGISYQRNFNSEIYPKDIRNESYWTRQSIPHQSAITSRKVFDKLGSYNQNLRYCMDFELFYKAYQEGFKFLAVPYLITSVNCEGISTTSWKAQLDEFAKVQKERGASFLAVGYYYYKRYLKMWIYYTLVRIKFLN